MRRVLKKSFLGALAMCLAVPCLAETSVPVAERDADILIVQRRNKMLVEDLSDIVSRCDDFYAEMKNLPENEIARRAADLAERFESLLERFPDSVPVLFFFAEFLRAGGENERAESLLLKAESLDEDFAPAQFILAEILAERGAAEEAFPRFRRGISEDSDAESVAIYGEFLCDNQEVLLAKKCFKNREDLDRNMQDVFRRAAIFSDNNPDFYWRYAESFYDVEKPDWRLALLVWEIVGDLPAVKKDSARLVAVAIHRARVLAELGRIDEADALLRENVGIPALERSRRQVFDIIRQKRAGK